MEVILLKLKFWLTPISPYLKEKNLDLAQDSNNVRMKQECKTRPEFFHCSWNGASLQLTDQQEKPCGRVES